jgi:RND family efflux transporter MFP subunit
MKRWQLFAAIPLLITILGSIGYLGFRNAAPGAADTPEPPSTVAVSVCDVEKTVTAPGSLVSSRQTTLGMPADGRLAEVTVNAGDSVVAGQTLASLDDRQTYEEAVVSARLALLEAQQELDALPGEARKEEAQLQIDLLATQKDLDRYVRWLTYLAYPQETQDSVVRKARQTLQAAERVYEVAKNELHEKSHLPESHPNRKKAQEALDIATLARDRALAELTHLLDDATEEAIVRAQADVNLTQAKVDEMTRRLEALHNGPAELDRALLEGEAARAQAKLSAAEEALANIEIKAPFDGIVLEVKADPGETLAKGAPIILMSDPQALEVDAQVIEEDLPLVSVGQPAVLYFDAVPDAEITGRVARIVPKRLEGDRPLYLVTLELENIPAGLAAGMSADVSIVLERAEDVLCLPRALVRAGSDGSATLTVWNGQSTETRTVQVGLRGDTNVAILSGLQEGDQVVAR